jgi:hypothetical protein
MRMRGSICRAPSSVVARAVLIARTSTVEPATPSICTLPLVLTIRTSPPGASG